MRKLIFLLTLFLVACSSSPDQPPKVNSVDLNIFHVFDVIKQNSSTYTFSWLSRSQSKPLRLVQFTLQDGEKTSQEIYQWTEGDKALQRIKVTAETEAIPQYINDLHIKDKTHLDLDIRLDQEGKIVFQKIFLNNRYYQFNENNLRFLEDRANKEANLLKARNRKHFRTYQGSWHNGVFIDCDGGHQYDVSFLENTSIPDSALIIIRAYMDEPLVFGDISLEEADIIWQGNIGQQCFKVPE